MQWSSRDTVCIFILELMKTGQKTDSEICELAKSRYPVACNTLTSNAIRSVRGRLERAGTLQRGVALSSKHAQERLSKSKKKDPPKKQKAEKPKSKKDVEPKAQQWSPAADLKLMSLIKAGWTDAEIAKKLYEEHLRRTINPGAVRARRRHLKLMGKLEASPSASPTAATVSITSDVSQSVMPIDTKKPVVASHIRSLTAIIDDDGLLKVTLS